MVLSSNPDIWLNPIKTLVRKIINVEYVILRGFTAHYKLNL